MLRIHAIILLVASLSACGDDGGSASNGGSSASVPSASSSPLNTSASTPPVNTSASAAPKQTAAPAAAGTSPAPLNVTTNTKSIREWVSCDGVSDDSVGVAQAFKAASNNAFTLVVDCPVRLAIGMDISHTVFIDNGTTVEFTGAGKFTVDNVFLPAFVVANSNAISLVNWNVEYDGGLPVDWNVGGYRRDGQFVVAAGYAQPASAFNNFRISPWLSDNRAITFRPTVDESIATSMWVGATNTSAVFFLTGDTYNVKVTGMRLYASANAGGDKFIPMAFSLSANYKNDQTVTKDTPLKAQFVAVPHDLTFSDIDLDGTYMGWQGNARNVVFEHIRSHRYGDLQDSKGQNVGGVGKWFAPPHLFYLNYVSDGDAALFNQGIEISDVIDYGVRVGQARDKGGSDTVSGSALSLKIGCVSCSVDNYRSSRPDGFLDVLPSEDLIISNVVADYNSEFVNNLYPGIRFPSTSYKGITFENILLGDLASSSTELPISNSFDESNQAIVFKNTRVTINRWAGAGLPLPTFAGTTNDLSFDYTLTANALHLVSSEKGNVGMRLQATLAAAYAGGSTTLTWISRGATSCASAGLMSDPSALGAGTQVVKLGVSGNYNFTLSCRNPADSASATLTLAVKS